MNIKLFTPFIIAAALVSHNVIANDAPKRPAPLVAVSEVEQAEIAEQAWVPGTVVSRFDSRLSTEVAGVVKWVAEVGEEFEKGDVVLKLDDAFLQLELQQANATISRLETRVSLLQKQQQRLTKLGKNAALDALDEKAADLEMAQQELLQAELAVKRIELQLTKTALRAPFSGTVVERYKQVGEYSQLNNATVRLVSMNNLEVKANAPLNHTQFNRIGDTVVVRQKGTQLESKIRALIPVGDERSRTMEVRIALNNHTLPIGSAVRVSLASSESHQALTVHRDALVLRHDKVYVNVIDDELKATQVTVIPGSGFYDYIEVKSTQLKAGQKVAVRGSENLRDGATVRLKESKQLTASVN